MATVEFLKCEPGAHEWTRLPTRGRKPRHCPDHAPEVAPTGPRTLHCELGDHEWIRPPAKGKLPRNCPEHKPVVVNEPKAPTELYCETGDHHWLRPPTRGRAAKNCPEHKPEPAVARERSRVVKVDNVSDRIESLMMKLSVQARKYPNRM